MSAVLGCIFSYYRSIYLKNFPGAHAPGPSRTLAPAARAKNAFGILFSPPNRENAARALTYRYNVIDLSNQSMLCEFLECRA